MEGVSPTAASAPQPLRLPLEVSLQPSHLSEAPLGLDWILSWGNHSLEGGFIKNMSLNWTLRFEVPPPEQRSASFF
jgi:hypothetical protein